MKLKGFGTKQGAADARQQPQNNAQGPPAQPLTPTEGQHLFSPIKNELQPPQPSIPPFPPQIKNSSDQINLSTTTLGTPPTPINPPNPN